MTPFPHSEPDLEQVSKTRWRRRRSRSRRRLGRRTIVFLWAIGCLITAGSVVATAYYSNRASRTQGWPNAALRSMSQRAIQAQYAQGVMLTFSPADWTKVKALPGGTYEVSGWYQAVPQAGPARSYLYTCKLVRATNGWSVDDLEVLPQ